MVVQWKCSLQKICLLAQKHFIFISLLKYFPKTISMFTVRVAQTTNTREEIFLRSVADISRISIFLFLLLILRVLLIYPDNSSLFSKYIYIHSCVSFDSWFMIHHPHQSCVNTFGFNCISLSHVGSCPSAKTYFVILENWVPAKVTYVCILFSIYFLRSKTVSTGRFMYWEANEVNISWTKNISQKFFQSFKQKRIFR